MKPKKGGLTDTGKFGNSKGGASAGYGSNASVKECRLPKGGRPRKGKK